MSSLRHAVNKTFLKGLTIGFTGHIYTGRGADLLFALAKEMSWVNFMYMGGMPELVAH